MQLESLSRHSTWWQHLPLDAVAPAEGRHALTRTPAATAVSSLLKWWIGIGLGVESGPRWGQQWDPWRCTKLTWGQDYQRPYRLAFSQKACPKKRDNKERQAWPMYSWTLRGLTALLTNSSSSQVKATDSRNYAAALNVWKYFNLSLLTTFFWGISKSERCHVLQHKGNNREKSPWESPPSLTTNYNH